MTYHNFAAVYDELMVHAPYDKWTTFTKHVIERYQLDVDHIVDLGCGTGEITLRLAKMGYRMTGVDLSESMLTVAANKANVKNITVNWLQQDIRTLTGFSNEKLIISYCDVINYLEKKQQLKETFQRIHNSLATGGLFVFDVHSKQYMNEFLIDETFTYVAEDIAYIWDCERGKHENEMIHYLTFFVKDMDQYERFDEVHTQTVYSINTYETTLKSVGFNDVHVFTNYSLKNEKEPENSERIFIIARK